MFKSDIGTSLWDEMSGAQQLEAVSSGRATLKQMVEGFLDGPSKLREACRSSLANSDICLEHSEPAELHPELEDERSHETIATAVSAAIESAG